MPTSLPSPRGPLTDQLLDALQRPPHALATFGVQGSDPLGDDLQLALAVLQELAHRPVAGVDDAWEHEPSAVVLRLRLERHLERHLRDVLAVPAVAAAEVPDALVELVTGADGPSLSHWVAEHGTLEHLRELAVHRALYQLKEADPHSVAIPRLAAGEAKAALLDIQVDEYGCEPGEAHAVLFAQTMTALGLDPAVGPDIDRLPAATLATSTLLGLLGSARRLVGALLGHLAVFEMCSVEPMARYAAAVRRKLPGATGTAAARFYDVHVAADGRHQHVALDRMVRGFADEDPERAPDVLFGAAALLEVERRFAEHLLACWQAGTTSLRAPLPGSRQRGADPGLRLAG